MNLGLCLTPVIIVIYFLKYIDSHYSLRKDMYYSMRKTYELCYYDEELITKEQSLFDKLMMISMLMEETYADILDMNVMSSDGKLAIAFKGKYLMMPSSEKWKRNGRLKEDQLAASK